MGIVMEAEVRPADRRNLASILREEERRQSALEGGDVTVLRSIFDNDAILIHSCGVVENEDTFLEAISRRDSRFERTEIHVFRVRQLGSNAMLLSGAAVTDAVFFGQEHHLDELFVMTWMKRADGWKLSSYHSTAVDAADGNQATARLSDAASA